MTVAEIWGSVRSILKEHFTFSDLKDLVGAAGLPIHQLAHVQQGLKGYSKGQLLDEIDRLFLQLDDLNFHAEEHGQNKLAVHPGEVALHLGSDGYAIQSNHYTFHPQRIESIQRLLAFQLVRTSKKISDFAIATLKQEKKLGASIFRAHTKKT